MAKSRPAIKFHPEAALEARLAVEWYSDHSEEVAERFKKALRRAERSVIAHPRSWTPYYHGTRCFKLDPFPYVLVYIQRDERIIGIAVAHLHRRPGYWRDRLRD